MKTSTTDYLIIIGVGFFLLVFFAAAREPAGYSYLPGETCSGYSC